jgi:amino acid transporter
MRGRRWRRALVIILAVAAVSLGVLFPVFFPTLPEGATASEVLARACAIVVYFVVVLLLLCGVVLVAAREIRVVLEQYREARRSNVRELIMAVGRAMRKSQSNGKGRE